MKIVTTARVAAVVCVLLLFPGCVPPPPATTAVAAPTSGKPQPTETVPERQWCYDGVPYNPRSPEYRGPGPHLATVAALPSGSWLVSTLSPGAPLLPRRWYPAMSDQFDRNRVTLVVCAFLPTPAGTQRTGTCDCADQETKRPRAVDIVPARYSFTVLEARTGRKIGQFTLPGSENHCPRGLQVAGGQSIGQRVGEAAFAAELDPFVHGKR
ncbi:MULTISPECIES: hypothetical protein [unclassified Crossiella]|uniref:hypothetical protein n=1 Tax=unclassified Crossiella TaxID=2620835 RepID=UPI002000268D|nr:MULTISPECIES: hypothetical protein [unclassified Crossiella]MCK2239090.1 hypothetical protein [Crossiella sp. S99.2]MCK2251341.1 hypothetical protein [Crossiella sp. S99.1]